MLYILDSSQTFITFLVSFKTLIADKISASHSSFSLVVVAHGYTRSQKNVWTFNPYNLFHACRLERDGKGDKD